jgi:hypothetical protein
MPCGSRLLRLRVLGPSQGHRSRTSLAGQFQARSPWGSGTGGRLLSLYPLSHYGTAPPLRVIANTLKGIPLLECLEGEQTHRVITTLLDLKAVPTDELAALYPEAGIFNQL